MKLTWKYPFVTFPKAQDCLICAFKLMIDVSILFGAECPHMPQKSLKYRVYTTTSRLWLYLGLNLIPTFTWCYMVHMLTFTQIEQKSFLNSIFDFFSSTWTLILVVTIAKNRNECVKYHNGIVALISQRKRFGIPVLFSHKHIKKTQYASLYVLLATCAIGSIKMVITIQNIGYGLISIMQAISYCLNVFYGVYFSFYLAYWMGVYKKIFERLLDLLRKEFDHRLIHRNPDSIFSSNFAQKVCLYQNYYACCILNYQNHVLINTNIFFNVIHFIFVITCQVFTYLYVPFLLMHPKVSSVSDASVGLAQSIFIVSITYYCIDRATDIYNIGEGFISYLHRYPISMLTEEESRTVEALIDNLSHYKPTLTTGDIFSLHKKMIPSVLAHVITYSLVAMQFNILRKFY